MLTYAGLLGNQGGGLNYKPLGQFVNTLIAEMTYADVC
jgi:hypothetical protein